MYQIWRSFLKSPPDFTLDQQGDPFQSLKVSAGFEDSNVESLYKKENMDTTAKYIEDGATLHEITEGLGEGCVFHLMDYLTGEL